MATFKGEEYKFPDEAKEETQVAVQMDIEDDVLDKKSEVKEPSDEELVNYKQTKTDRYKKLTQGYKEERRAKERAELAQQTAEEFAKSVLEENRRLQAQLANGSKQYIETSKSAAETRLASAKDKLKAAYEAGNTSEMADAQQEMAEATAELREARNMRPVEVEEKQFKQAPPEQQRMSPRTQKWLSKNSNWFGPDEEMTMAAMGIDKKLQREYGPEYVGTKDYFKTIDKTMRKRFPEFFGDQTASDDDSDTPAQEVERRAKPATVVAPASRSTPPSRVRLEPRQVALARKLGITPEQYAKQVALINRGE